jgi:hypothetical protein
MTRMRPSILGTLAIALLATHQPILAQRRPPSRPQLEGVWNGATLTPLERPAGFEHRATFTPEEAAEYKRTSSDRTRSKLPSAADRLTQADIDETYVETEVFTLDRLRTSLIVDPPHGRLPDLLPEARARIAARPKRSFEDPETFGLAERCLLGNFGAGGSLASPPLMPSEVIPGYYKIVQTDAHVMIFTEWIHDARIVRMNSTHLSPAIRQWLGDSIGFYEESTLVVDTTNFRGDTRNLNSGERLHVVERFTRIDPKTMRYRVTVADPDTWATPWTAEWLFKAIDARLYGIECHEGNYAIEHFLRGARFEERERGRQR